MLLFNQQRYWNYLELQNEILPWRNVNTTHKSKIDFIEHPSYACEIQKHTKHTLFAVLICWDAGVRHFVYNLVKEHSCCDLNNI